jgi:hypothetical protein
VHQVLNPGSIVTEKRQRYTVARGEHLVALLEEPDLEHLVCLVQHQVLERRERQQLRRTVRSRRTSLPLSDCKVG